MIGRSVMKSVLVASVCLCATWCQAADEVSPSVRPLSDEDFASGIVLTKIGTGESFDFSAPEGAEVCADWEAFGAARDWFRLGFGVEDDFDEYESEEGWSFAMGTNRVDSFTVFSYGTVRPSVTNVNTCVSPLNAVIGIVPVSNHGMLDAADRPSRFWHYLTPSNTLQLTWQNVLLDREVSKPVSFQAEIDMLGDVTFKYDLSRLPEEALANLSVGVMNDGRGRMFSCLPRDITSLRWRYLDPSLPNFSDHDGDGISTSDELFIYGTDPYSADTDRDGLTDGEEIAVTKTNPTDRYSSDPRFIDSVASALGGEDPYSCPNGDGRTAFENVVYTGSSDGRGGEPASGRNTAVLEVTAVGSGRGVLMVGDKMVPLLQGVNPIKVAVPKGLRMKLKCELEGELYLNYNSSDFCIGKLPYGARERGWVLFPKFEATHPCIHTDTCVAEVRLDPGVDDDDFTCAWRSDTEDVGVENFPPLSARLAFSFSRKSTASVRYEVRHPKYLFGETSFRQVCEYCPKIADDEEYSSTKDYDDNEPTNDSNAEPEWCDEHMCPKDWCRDRHNSGGSSLDPLPGDESVHSAYSTATNSPSQFEYVLKLHRPDGVSEKYDSQKIHVYVSTNKFQCCDCEEHWASYASIGYKNRRVNVHCNGVPFIRTAKSCDLTVYGVGPSSDYGDSRVSIVTNGATWVDLDYTVFGVSILGHDVDLRRLNELNSDFGMPVVINTNLNNAAEIKLCTDVNLPDGIVRLAFENAKARMQLWMTYTVGDYYGHEKHIKILDSETCPSREFRIQEWRSLVGKATYNRETTLKLLAYGCGSAKLFFGYAGGKDGKYLHDEAVQTITAIRPPLLPDYNRDGRIDDDDAFDYSNGRIKYFWANQDGWQGDDAFKQYSSGWWDFNWSSPKLPRNCDDDVVNGKNDLVNLCPLSVSVEECFKAWGNDAKYEFYVSMPGDVRFVPVKTEWHNVRKLVCEPQRTFSGEYLHESELISTAFRKDSEVPYEIPEEFIMLGNSSNGVFAVEFADAIMKQKKEKIPLAIRIRDRKTEDVLLQSELQLTIMDVHDMYRWINLFDVCGKQLGSDFDSRTDVLWPDDEHADANVIFVHGYNMHHTEGWDWSQAMFKRLWWSGMDAGFTAVAWRGNQSQFWSTTLKTFIAKNYHQNVLNAFRTAESLAKVTETIPGKKKYFIAHSLGNMLVSAARQDYGLKYDKYIMLNAAVALEAYDPSGVTDESKTKMTPVCWRGYPDRVRASHWHELFQNGDARRMLAWKGRFKDVNNTVNFYSSKDEVVANGNDSVYDVLTREYAWYNQEQDKGGHLVDLCPEAGWAFNDEYLVGYKKTGRNDVVERCFRVRTPNETATIGDSQMKNQPFFEPFSHNEIHSESGSEFLSKRENSVAGWRALSHGIPAESFATGANPVPKWNVKKQGKKEAQKRDAQNSEIRNVDMETECGSHAGGWQHSYFINRSLFDVGGLFGKITTIINKGRLIRGDSK